MRKQTGATLIIALVMLLVVTLIGLSGLFGVTLQEKQANTLSENRALYSEANNLLLSTLNTIGRNVPESEPASVSSPADVITTPAIGSIRYENLNKCGGIGDDHNQPFICKAVIATVGFDQNGDGAIDNGSPTAAYTQFYKYRQNSN